MKPKNKLWISDDDRRIVVTVRLPRRMANALREASDTASVPAGRIVEAALIRYLNQTKKAKALPK